jgi:hypothetical protein
LFDSADQFGPAGYNALLLGQKVPHNATHQSDDSERRAWEAFRDYQKRFALGALTVPEALAAIRSPAWAAGG